ncbi:MAG TPA: hypothetical protein VLS93_06295, partial [Anaeromyxobacteraceae bacterium]|nr:hypothetical protein [Anaeromyxobacteraceae bacterium]
MSTRPTSIILALLLGLHAPPARAQVRAPTLVDENEQPEEPAPEPPPRRVRERLPPREDVPLPPVPAPDRGAREGSPGAPAPRGEGPPRADAPAPG